MPFHLPTHPDLAVFEQLKPTAIPDPYWVGFSASTAKLLGIDHINGEPNPDYLELLAGNQTQISVQGQMHEFQPYATAYSGHQFGVWAGQLGDGRAIYLGDMNGQELQLKGAGKTAYSRMGDGRAVLRSSIREFLCSEAMHALRVPTSRALAVVGSDMRVFRETPETAAVCARVAPSFLRVGHIEHYGYNDMQEELRATLDHLITHHYPECQNSSTPYLKLLEAIALRTAHMVALWQSVGFCHGVLNTDNTSLIGITLDYGPFGFLDQFEIDHICNHSDHGGRYAYHRQAEVLHWNMYCLANGMIQPLQEELKRSSNLDQTAAIEVIKNSLNLYNKEYAQQWQSIFRQKLGLMNPLDGDIELLEELMQSLHHNKLDFTLFFRNLSEGHAYDHSQSQSQSHNHNPESSMQAWDKKYQERLSLEKQSIDQRLEKMCQINPKYVLRNHLAQRAIELAQKRDFSEVARLLKILENPYQSQAVSEDYAIGPPSEMAHLPISCSS